MNRPRRRALTMGGLVLDIASLLALAGAVLAGALPSGRTTGLAVTLAIGLAAEVAYLYWSRP